MDKKKEKKAKAKVKALVLFSGGLDSRLAIKLLQEQGIDVIAVHFKLPFGEGCCKGECSFNFAQLNDVPLKIVDCTKGKLFSDYIALLKKPKHGYGTAINPCIDCHIFILKNARKMMKPLGADFIATGEVLNERPMSQHKKALELVEKQSGLKGKLLRPLSAKLLTETEAEKKGLVNRSMLLSIKGRRRIEQIALAQKYKIKYPHPAGGCILCEKEFAVKLHDFFEHSQKINYQDIELLQIGRHFRIEKAKIIIGRNERENKRILELAGKNYIFEVKDIPSPISVATGKISKDTIKKTASLTVRYSDCDKGIVRYGKGKFNKEIHGEAMSEEEINKLRIK